MEHWAILYKRENSSLPEDLPNSIRINKNNITYISIFDNKIRVDFINGEYKIFKFEDWDINL